MKTFEEALLNWARDYFKNPDIEKVVLDTGTTYSYSFGDEHTEYNYLEVIVLEPGSKKNMVSCGVASFFFSEIEDLLRSFYESVTKEGE